MPNPYIPKEPNDLIRAADWNQIQIDARNEIQSGHDHTGGDKGQQLGTDAIADGAVTMAKLGDDVDLGGGMIGTDRIENGAVTMDKLAPELAELLDMLQSKVAELEIATANAMAQANLATSKAMIALGLQTQINLANTRIDTVVATINEYHGGNPDIDPVPDPVPDMEPVPMEPVPFEDA